MREPIKALVSIIYLAMILYVQYKTNFDFVATILLMIIGFFGLLYLLVLIDYWLDRSSNE